MFPVKHYPLLRVRPGIVSAGKNFLEQIEHGLPVWGIAGVLHGLDSLWAITGKGVAAREPLPRVDAVASRARDGHADPDPTTNGDTDTRPRGSNRRCSSRHGSCGRWSRRSLSPACLAAASKSGRQSTARVARPKRPTNRFGRHTQTTRTASPHVAGRADGSLASWEGRESSRKASLLNRLLAS